MHGKSSHARRFCTETLHQTSENVGSSTRSSRNWPAGKGAKASKASKKSPKVKNVDPKCQKNRHPNELCGTEFEHSRESGRRNWPPIATFRRRANGSRSRSTGQYITTTLRGDPTPVHAPTPGSDRAGAARGLYRLQECRPRGDSAARRPWRSLRGAAKGGGVVI